MFEDSGWGDLTGPQLRELAEMGHEHLQVSSTQLGQPRGHRFILRDTREVGERNGRRQEAGRGQLDSLQVAENAFSRARRKDQSVGTLIRRQEGIGQGKRSYRWNWSVGGAHCYWRA